MKEEHYSVVIEPGGGYLFHFVPNKTDHRKHAEIIADHLVDGKKFRKAVKSHRRKQHKCKYWVGKWWDAIGGKKIEKEISMIVCNLHTNELGLRHLIISLDGLTKCGKSWSGPLRKMLNKATDLEINPSFTKIDIGSPLIVLSPEIIKGFSTDQSCADRIRNKVW